MDNVTYIIHITIYEFQYIYTIIFQYVYIYINCIHKWYTMIFDYRILYILSVEGLASSHTKPLSLFGKWLSKATGKRHELRKERKEIGSCPQIPLAIFNRRAVDVLTIYLPTACWISFRYAGFLRVAFLSATGKKRCSKLCQIKQ